MAIAERRDISDIEKQFTEESEALTKKFNLEEINRTEDKVNKIKELEKKKNEDIIKDEEDRNNKLKELQEKREQSIIDSVGKIGGEFGNIAEGLTTQFLKLEKLLDNTGATWQDYASVVTGALNAISESSALNAEAQKAIAVTQAIINTAVAVTKVYPNIPLSILIGALGAAQIATILGAEDGVIGLNSSYNKKPGKTDKYPFLLAKGESVVNAQSTAQNRPYLEFINNGGNIGRDIINPLIKENQSMKKELQDMKKILKTATLSKVNLVVENRNNSNVRMGAVRV